MEFDTDWKTLGRHRIRLRSTKGFPTRVMRRLADVTRLAIDNNMSARARIVDIVFRQERAYDITVGTTLAEDRLCAPQLESAIATVMGLLPAQVNVDVQVVTQEEVDLNFGVYERALAEKLGVIPPLQKSCPEAGHRRSRPHAPASPLGCRRLAGRCRTSLPAQCFRGNLFFGRQRQLLVGSLFFLERLKQQRDRVRFTELFGQRDQRSVGGNFVVLDLLCGRNQGSVQHRAPFNFVDLLLALLDQAFHRHAFNALETDPAAFHHLIYPLDLTLGFFQMSDERRAQIGVARGAGKFGQRLGHLFFRAVNIGKGMNKKIVD